MGRRFYNKYLDPDEEPGPDEYEANQAFKYVRDRTQLYKLFGTSKRKNIYQGVEGIPGPAMYKLPSSFDRYSRTHHDRRRLKIEQKI